MVWVTRIVSAGALLVLVRAPSLSAQTCAPPPAPYFEFQVDVRAVFLPDSSISPRPSARRAAKAADEDALVQFVIDTLGRPDVTSFKVLLARDRAIATEARDALPRWRFRPATRGGCLVPQLFQTPLER